MRRAALLAVIGVTAVLAALPAAGSSQGGESRQAQTGWKAGDCSGVSDETIKNQVLANLQKQTPPFDAPPYLEAVEVKKGYVRVQGAVTNSSDWRLLEATVKSTPCVRGVDLEDLKVSCATITAVPNVRGALNDLLPCAVSGAISLTASDGEITLTGTVPSNKDKKNAGEVAKSIDYVKDVNNRLRVSPPQSAPTNCQAVTDEQVKASVESAIRSKFPCPILCSFVCVQVSVRNRVVTLTGSPRRGAIPDIIQTAQSVPCVTQVIPTGLLPGQEPGCTGGLSCRDASGQTVCCIGCTKCPRIE